MPEKKIAALPEWHPANIKADEHLARGLDLIAEAETAHKHRNYERSGQLAALANAHLTAFQIVQTYGRTQRGL